jgi:hypothetical protein
MSKAAKKQDKPVVVYWTDEFVDRLDAVCAGKSQRRNDYIKEHVRKAVEADERAIAKQQNKL